MGKKKRPRAGSPYYWESDDFNRLCFYQNFEMLFALALNRFRWVGLPETCDARFLEYNLHAYGVATICHAEGMPDVWQTLQASAQGPFNAYGLPTRWIARGWDATNYEADWDSGTLVWYSQTRLNPWSLIYMYANKLTQYQRTEDVNLYNQRHTQIWVAPKRKRQELVNLMKQSAGFEPIVLGDEQLLELNEQNVFCIDSQDPIIVEELGKAYQNTLNQYLLQIGIPHLAFEKGERMIEDEARANSMPSTIMLKNCLDARRWACDELRRIDPSRFADLQVYLNDDWESYNFNYINNLESKAQDGYGGDSDDQGEADA